MHNLKKSKLFIHAKILLFVLVFSFFYALIPKIMPASAAACAAHNVSGYAWSENIGWISFACPALGSGEDYGVDINNTTGQLSGYAWSENIGWISFNRADTGVPPAAPYNGAETYLAKLDLGGTNKLTGWARALSYSGGWDGWIKLSGTGYGVTLNTTSKEFEGFAWSDAVIGWVSFNCLNQAVCAASNYKVTTAIYPNPPASLQVKVKGAYYTNPYNVQDPCSGYPCLNTPTPYFQWTPAGTQTAYQIQVDNDSDFSSTLWDSGWVNSSNRTNIIYNNDFGGEDLAWGIVYYWRVKTQSGALESNWGSAKFMTNRNPIADFSSSKTFGSGTVTVDFTSTSIDPDAGLVPPAGFSYNVALAGSIDNARYAWDLDGDGSFEIMNSGPAASKTYNTAVQTSVNVKMRAIDDGGLANTITKTVLLKSIAQLKTESGDIYSKGNIEGQNIDFGGGTYLIHAGGTISDVSGTTYTKYSGYTDINFPTAPTSGYQYANALGRIDWEGLKPPSTCIASAGVCSDPNRYGHTVEKINSDSQIDDPLNGKVYYNEGDLDIHSNAVTIKNGTSAKLGNGLILVNGDFIIEKNIDYNTAPAASNLKNLASVGWIIKGDLIIDPSVTKIVGIFVVLGADGSTGCPMSAGSMKPPAHCGLVKTGSALSAANPNDQPLVISGMLVARRIFFQRSVAPTAGSFSEKIIYNQNSFLNPPPGMEDFVKGLPAWQRVAP